MAYVTHLKRGSERRPIKDLEAARASSIALNYSDLSFPIPGGKLCWHDDVLYRAKDTIQESEAWVASHWETASVADIVEYITSKADDMKNLAETMGADLYYDSVTHTLYLMNPDDECIGEGVQLSGTGGLAFDGGYCAVNENDGLTYLHLTISGEELPSEIFTPFVLPGGSGGASTGDIVLSNVVKVTTVRNGQDAVFSFVATSSDDTDVRVVWKVDGVQISSSTGISGSTFTFNAKDYLRPSNDSVVRAQITNESGVSLPRQWTVTSTAFSLEWGEAVQPIMLYTEDEDVSIVLAVNAAAGTTNAVTVEVGNHSVTRNVPGSRNITVTLDKSWFSSGANTVTASMVSGTDPNDTADDITFVVLWGYGATGPMVAFSQSAMSGMQYDTAVLQYFVYDPSHEMATASIQVNSEDARSVNVIREIQPFRYTPMSAGTYTITLTCGAASTTMTLNAASNSHNIGMVTGDALRYNLDPNGHSNTDNDRSSFGNLVFGSGFDWTNGGFQTDAAGAVAFVVKKGSRVTLPRSLFADQDGNGKTIDVSFRITNSDQYVATALTDLNTGGTRGLVLRSNEGEIRLDNASGQVFRYCEESRIDMSILVEGITGQRVVTVWLDGIPSKVNSYTAAMLTQNENACVIGSDHCDIWIYAIRVYNTALEIGDMIQNYISLGSTTAEKVARCVENAIYDQNGKITPASLHAAAPNLTIIEIEAARMTTGKKDPVPADIRITDGNDVLELDKADGVNFKVQGTSSQAYARSALNMDIDFNGTDTPYKISNSSIPVKYLNIKVNVASSENANNSRVVDWYNEYQPYLIEARRNNPAVRDTVESKPCAVFFKNTGSAAVWISSQLVQPGDTILYVMGDLCNSKKNLEVFGQDGEGTHPTKACIEVSENETAAQQFRAVSTYDAEEGEWITGNKTDFEWRMEPAAADLNSIVSAWDSAVSWLASTNQDAATGNALPESVTYGGTTYGTDSAAYRLAKFKAEIGDYFAIQSLLFHFLYLEFFAAFDQVSKNTFYSYDWDATAQKYLWNITKCYDGDTILAFDNDGNPFGDYGIDYGDTLDGTAQGRSYFNAVANTIWQNIKAGYYAELSALYISLRSAGAWNAQDIASRWDAYQAKRPHAAMAQDMYNKYLAPYKTNGVVINGTTYGYDDNYLSRLAGSKTYQRRQFLTYQTDYMDGKYGYYSTSTSMQFRTNGDSGTKDLTIKSYAKTYVTVISNSSRAGSRKVAAGAETVFEGVSVGNNATIYVTPDRLIQHVKPLNETRNSTFAASGAAKLTEAELGGNAENTDWLSGTGVNIPSPLLKKLSIRNMVNFSSALNLAQNVELHELDTRGTNAGLITLPAYAPLTSVQLNACTGIAAFGLNDVETFTLASGANLTSVRVEGCNSVVGDAMLTYLQQAIAAGGSATRRIRMTGVNWSITSIDLLYTIATTWKGYDALGNEQNAPVITGRVSVNSWSQNKLNTVENVFGNQLTVIADQAGEIPVYTVSFLNEDGSAIKDLQGNDYVQYVDRGSTAYDPIQAGEVQTPTKASDAQYSYTFSGWDGIDSLVLANRSLTAIYSSQIRTYTVRWYAVAGVLLKQLTGVVYGSCVQYNSENIYDFPVLEDEESAYIYKVFCGWDKSTGFIDEDTDVYAVWERAELPSVGTDLEDMNIAQIAGVAKTKQCDTFFEAYDHTDIQVGRDFNYSNVQSQVLVATPTYFDGTAANVITTDIKLFDADAPSFTLAIDYEFVGSDANNCLLACYGEDGNEGFRLRLSTHPNIQWGDVSQNVGYTNLRGIVTLRHQKGSQTLYVGYNNIGNGVYNGQVAETAITRARATNTEALLTIGGITYSDNTHGYMAEGWVYWAKIWYEDLGSPDAKAIAAWPHETWRIHYDTLRKRIAGNTSERAAGEFVLNAPLALLKRMNSTATNVGGWDESELRGFVNSQVFDALPVSWQSIIRKVKVDATAGNRSTDITTSEDKIYLLAYGDCFTTTDLTYLAEAGTQIPFFTTNASRCKFSGFTLDDDVEYITAAQDPTQDSSKTVVHGKTVWINTSRSSNAYLYVDAAYCAKHKWACAQLLTSSENLDALGAQGGKWLLARWWWLRSPYLGHTNGFNLVYTNGSTGNDTANSAGALVCGFSI